MKISHDFTAKIYDPVLYLALKPIRIGVIHELLGYKEKAILDLYSKPTEVDGFCEKVWKSWMAFGFLDEKKGSSSFLVAKICRNFR